MSQLPLPKPYHQMFWSWREGDITNNDCFSGKNVIQWVSGHETYNQCFRQAKVFENIKAALLFITFYFGTTHSEVSNKKSMFHFLVYLIHSFSQSSIHLC